MSLTPAEKEVLCLLALAWGRFLLIPEDHPRERAEFLRAIHAGQALIGLRVARRVDPDFWLQGERELGEPA